MRSVTSGAWSTSTTASGCGPAYPAAPVPPPTRARASAGSADGLAQAGVELVELLAEGVHAPGAGLEHRGGVHRDPAEPERSSLLGPLRDPVVVLVEGLARGVPRRRGQHRLQADGIGIPTGGLGVAADLVDPGPHLVLAAGDHAHPTVAQFANAAEGGRPAAPDPDRQPGALRWLGLHGDRLGPEAATRLVDAVVAPAGPQERDHLVHVPAPFLEVLAQGFVLGGLPADADAEAHPAR